MDKEENKNPIRNDVEEGKVPFRDVLVTVRGTRMKFDFKGLSRERMGYDVLLNILKKDLRLRPNEVVDLEWWNDPCCPEWLTNDGQFFEFWDKAEPDSNGWINLQLQVHKVDENGCITEDGPVPPHYYCTPKKSPHIKKTVSKRQPNSTRKSPRLAAKSLQSQCASNSKRTLFVELENEEVYVPEAPTKMLDMCEEFDLIGVVKGHKYQVVSKHNKIMNVDLKAKTCSCNQWQLRGFVCIHAVRTLKYMRPLWQQYCDPCYTCKYYKATYAPAFEGLADEKEWVPKATEDNELIQPPVSINKQGRPRKRRMRGYDEPHKKGRNCSRCGQSGHYKSTCGGGPVGGNPKGKQARTCVNGDNVTRYDPGPSKRPYKKSKIDSGSTSVNCGGESSQQAPKESGRGKQTKQAAASTSSQSFNHQTFNNVCSVQQSQTVNNTVPGTKAKGKEKR